MILFYIAIGISALTTIVFCGMESCHLMHHDDDLYSNSYIKKLKKKEERGSKIDRMITLIRLINNDGVFLVIRSFTMHAKGSLYFGIVFATKELVSIIYRVFALIYGTHQDGRQAVVVMDKGANEVDKGVAPVINAPYLGFKRQQPSRGILW